MMMKKEIIELLNQIESFLTYQKEEGRLIPDMGDINLLEHREMISNVLSANSNPAKEPSLTVETTEKENSAGVSDKELKLMSIAERIAECKLCPLWKTRKKTVPGQGNPSPEIMFIGEGPGADEDEQGLAFVGRAGQLLTKMIEAMGFSREDVFIGNIVKCRPPGNRTPMPHEMEACMPFLKEQLSIIKPRVIVALGATAVKGLFNVSTGIVKLRGTWMKYGDVDVMPTYHPAYLLRNPPAKKEAWEDLKSVLAKIGRQPPPIKR